MQNRRSKLLSGMCSLVTLFPITFLAVTFLSGCSAITPKTFKDNQPKFILEDYFQGKTRGVGMFFDRFGGVQATFVVDLDGQWDGATLTLNEHLHFGNGEDQTRVYTLKKENDHLYRAFCMDFVGDSTLEIYGNALKWNYKLTQTYDGKTATLYYNDWMYLQPDGIVLDRSAASKFGLGIGEIFMSLRRL